MPDGRQLHNRVAVVQGNLERYLTGVPAPRHRLAPDAPLREGSSLSALTALRLFEDQLLSRLLDVMARDLKQQGLGYYTISGAGHEQNAILGAQLRLDDPAFLHYRSGGFMMARSRKDPASDPIFDTLLGMVASADDPVSGGRHKVWGGRRLWVPPQTSIIASHLPKAVGLAFALARQEKGEAALELPRDAVVMCSFGDASANHATALSAINAARYALRKGNPVPILFVCEDNQLGISVPTPRDWIEDGFSHLPFLHYVKATGELDELWDTVEDAVRTCRMLRRPVFLHLPTVRLWGHAGTDVETTYHSLAQIEANEALDPVFHNARRLVETGAAAPRELLALLEGLRKKVEGAAEEAIRRPRLSSVFEITRPLAPFHEGQVRLEATGLTGPPLVEEERRRAHFGGRLPEEAAAPSKRTLAAHINHALHDEMLRRPEIVVFGEDVAKKGGVYYVTQGLFERFGVGRVFDTLLDETTILGVAQGAAHAGLLPVPEIQYLAYLHNALDQLRGEACSLSFFSNGQFTNPMVLRVASFAYQRGFGGHFHNDNSIGALRDIPGLVLAAPSRGDDAARMLRGALALARANGRVIAFLEPIALYHQKDLHAEGDRGWLSDYPGPEEVLLPGEVGLHGGENHDLLLVSYANGLWLSLRAARRLEVEHGLRPRVLDLRWLNPLPLEAVREHARACRATLVVDECRATGGGVAEALLADLAEQGLAERVGSVRAADSYVPLGPAADRVLVSEAQIVDDALRLVAR